MTPRMHVIGPMSGPSLPDVLWISVSVVFEAETRSVSVCSTWKTRVEREAPAPSTLGELEHATPSAKRSATQTLIMRLVIDASRRLLSCRESGDVGSIVLSISGHEINVLRQSG